MRANASFYAIDKLCFAGLVARRVSPWLALAVWLGIGIWAGFDRPRRSFLMHALATWSLLVSLLWMCKPNYTLTLRGVTSNDNLFFGALMLFGWGAAWLFFRRGQLLDPTACRICGYNLTGNVSGICPECGTETPGMLTGRELT